MQIRRVSNNQITIGLISLSIIVYLLMLVGEREQILFYFMIDVPGTLMGPLHLWLLQPWRLITPMFLHFGILHILFNMFWLYDLGSLIEGKEGKLRFVLLVLLTSLGSSLLQFVIKGPMFGGMSGVVYGLFGYVWIAAKYDLRSGYYMHDQVVYWMLGWFALCFTGLIGPVANFGHLGGLLVGVGLAYMRKMLRR